MATTLNDVAKQTRDPLRKGVIMSILRYSDVLGLLPFENVDALESIAVRWGTLPTAGFRKLNAGYTEGSGDTEQVPEGVFVLGGDVDIDRVLARVKNVIEDPAVTQTKMKTKAVGYTFNNYFINGSPTLDADGFHGLEHRVGQLDSRQKHCIGTQGTPFDVTASAANEHKFLDGIAKLSALVGGADAYFCNFNMRLGYAAVLRRVGLLDTTKDQFDREVYTYAGAPIIDVGLQRDQATEIITDTEDPGDGGADTTSIYAVKFGTDDGLIGIQLNELEAYWVGGEDHELESKPVKRLRIDWAVGLAGFGKYYAARMYNLKPASGWT
jgi:hypothetical protein